MIMYFPLCMHSTLPGILGELGWIFTTQHPLVSTGESHLSLAPNRRGFRRCAVQELEEVALSCSV